MKWLVQLDYEFGEVEPNSIYFRRVCSDDVKYGSAYDTKKEALEAFCQGQFAIDQLRKEREAEQKKEEGWDKAIKEAKEKYGYGKPEERIDVVRDFSPYVKTAIFEPTNPNELIEASKELANKPTLAKYVRKVEMMKAEHGHRLDNIEAHIAKIENRLTEIEGVLSSIGSPDYDLRKKVGELEKKHRRLLKDYKTHLAFNHNYTMTPKDMELIRQYEPEE